MSETVYGVQIKLEDRALPVTAGIDFGLYNRVYNLSLSVPKNATVAHVATLSINLLENRLPITIQDGVNSESNIITSIDPTNGILGLLWPATQGYNISGGKVQADSVFQLIQNDIAGLDSSWKSGVLMQNGIGNFSRTIDLKRMGNIASPGSCDIELKNTNQFHKEMNDRGVYFNGQIAKIFKFTGTSKAQKWIGECQKPTWTSKRFKIPVNGIYNKRISNISTVISNDPISGNYKLAGDNANGKIVPISLGKLYPATGAPNRYAKFLRTSEQQTTLTNDDGAGNYCIPQGADIFPLVGYGDTASPHLSYKVQFGTSVIGAFAIDLSGKYIQVIVGGSSDGTSFVGKYRKVTQYAQLAGTATNGSPIITGISDTSKIVIGTKVFCSNGFASSLFDYTVLSKTSTTITLDANATSSVGMFVTQGYYFIGTGEQCIIVLESFFEKDLYAVSGAIDTPPALNAWVEIIDIPFEFNADEEPCVGFTDESGMPIVSGDYPRLAAYGHVVSSSTAPIVQGVTIPDVSFIQIPTFGYLVDLSAAGKNRLVMDLKLFKDTPDTMSTFSIFPCKNLIDYIAATLTLFGFPTVANKTVGAAGNAYSGAGIQPGTNFTAQVFSPGAFDRDDSTFEKRIITGLLDSSGGTFSVWSAYDFDLPTDKLSIEYDNYYIGVKFQSSNYYNLKINNARFLMMYRRFLGNAQVMNSNFSYGTGIFSKFMEYQNPVGSGIDDLPDYYYLKRTMPDSNKAFYFNIDTSPSIIGLITGLNLFQITDFTTVDNLKSIIKASLVYGIEGDRDIVDVLQELHIMELALICEKSFNIASDLYAMFIGRIYNDTFGGRKTPTDYPCDPVNMLEMICRLQGGSENDFTDVNGWGHSYWKNALIKTSGDGSFDDTVDPDLASIKTLDCGGQILDYNDAQTNDIKRKLCYQFGMANWVDANGNECVKPIRKGIHSPTDLITIYQILDRSSIEVDYPDPVDLYAEPFVQYNKNPATGNYDSIIKMTNSSFENPTDAQKLSFVIGCQSQSAATYIYDKCQDIFKRAGAVEPPPSDMTDLDFVHDYDTALQHLIDWINWMYNPEISFKIPTSSVDGWEECHRFIIQLPHQTDNVEIECLLEEHTINPNDEHESVIKAIIFSDTIPEGFSFQDSLQLIGQLSQDSNILSNPLKQAGN